LFFFQIVFNQLKYQIADKLQCQQIRLQLCLKNTWSTNECRTRATNNR